MNEIRALLERLASETPLYLRQEDRPPRPRLEVGDLRRALRDYFAGRDRSAAAWPIPFSRLRDATDGGIRPGQSFRIGRPCQTGRGIDGGRQDGAKRFPGPFDGEQNLPAGHEESCFAALQGIEREMATSALFHPCCQSTSALVHLPNRDI